MARFDRLTVLSTFLEDGLVPLFYHGNLETARCVAAALARAGCNALEFTNRGDFAIEVFSGLVKHCAQNQPQLIIGVGSVEDAATAALFIAHGANFVVGPYFNQEIARLCNRRKIAYLPGCASITEIATAEEWGVEIVKLFPGETIGGPAFVKAVLGPRPWTRIMPTGGVSAEDDNLREWFDAGVACVGMGSHLIRGEWVKGGDYEAIEKHARAILDRILRIRSDTKPL
jgi:2-dehydro-3-deoxyphosphogluconate aldolase/(4S)-4-hydroxy-2-oxoglutarate aldolase